MVDLIIVGSVAFDDVKTPFGSVKNALGGSAVYGSYAASFFVKSGIVAISGKDFVECLMFLNRRGISTEGVEISKKGKTFHWEGFYEYDMNEAKTIKTEVNAFKDFKPKIPENYRNAKYVFLANIDPELELEILKQMKKPEFVLVDTMNYWIERKRESVVNLMRKADCVLMNDAEARQLFFVPNLALIGRKILQMGPKYAIIKKGEHGALLFSKDEHGNIRYFNAPGYPLENVIDPTGAGDSFAGGMLGYLAKTKDLSEANIRRAVIYGSVLASFNAEGFSLNNLCMITNDDIEKRFEKFKKIREF